MEEQIPMILQITGQNVLFQQPYDGLRLGNLPANRPAFDQPQIQGFKQMTIRLLTATRPNLALVKPVQISQEMGVDRPAREVEIPKHLLEGRTALRVKSLCRHV